MRQPLTLHRILESSSRQTPPPHRQGNTDNWFSPTWLLQSLARENRRQQLNSGTIRLSSHFRPIYYLSIKNTATAVLDKICRQYEQSIDQAFNQHGLRPRDWWCVCDLMMMSPAPVIVKFKLESIAMLNHNRFQPFFLLCYTYEYSDNERRSLIFHLISIIGYTRQDPSHAATNKGVPVHP